jgi:hypothetical protein
VLFAGAAQLAACAIPVTMHDPVTFERLCDLKVECLDLLDRLERAARLDERTAEEVHRARLGVRKLVEREAAKGGDNAETTAQIRKIQELFEDDLDEFLRGDLTGRLGAGYAAQARSQLAQAFDIAIATEALKNREGG